MQRESEGDRESDRENDREIGEKALGTEREI